MFDENSDIIEISGNAYYLLGGRLVIKDFEGDSRIVQAADLSVYEQIIFEALVRLSQLN